MAYTLGNKCAKNLCKRTVLHQLIIKNVVTCFFGTQCICIVATMAASLAICEIFSVKECRDLENWVMGCSRSLKIASFGRP